MNTVTARPMRSWMLALLVSFYLSLTSFACDFAPEVKRQKLVEIDSIKIFMTHGDLFKVKENYNKIFDKAKEVEADIAMFGHTHYAENLFVEGLHLFNPGSIIPRGRNYGSVGYMEIQNGKILQLEHLTF